MCIDQLQDSADGENDGAEDEACSPAEAGGDGHGEEAAEEGACLEDGDGIGVDGCLLGLAVAEVGLEGFEG